MNPLDEWFNDKFEDYIKGNITQDDMFKISKLYHKIKMEVKKNEKQ